MLSSLATTECDTNPDLGLEPLNLRFLAVSTRSNISNSNSGSVYETETSFFNNDLLKKELLLDLPEKVLDCEGLRKSNGEAIDSFHNYENNCSLMQGSLAGNRELGGLKFFGREFQYLSCEEMGCLRNLNCSKLNISSYPVIESLGLLMEFQLESLFSSSSALCILNRASSLICLTKLSFCNISIRNLPSDIYCLRNLKTLDLSFNKLKRLPSEICCLPSLEWLSVSNNKLLDVSSRFSCLRKLEHLDLSNNRLTTIDSLQLNLMTNLQYLNLQNNKLLKFCQIPEWVHCDLEGNEANYKRYINSSDEMDIIYMQECTVESFSIGLNSAISKQTSSNSRSSSPRTFLKRWKRKDYLLQKARQERLNISRKCKNEGRAELMKNKEHESKNSGHQLPTSEISDNDLTSEALTDLIPAKCLDSEDSVREESLASNKDGSDCSDLISCADSSTVTKESYCAATSYATSKRQSDGELNNPKPHKFQRPSGQNSALSRKYNEFSFCGISDYLSDGFYDAGRDRPFMPLNTYEYNFYLGSREVILLDREKDEELDALVLSAQSHVSRMKKHLSKGGNFQIVSWLVLFVSDHFGGCDRTSCVELARKAVSGSNYNKPFICTCSSGTKETLPNLASTEQLNFAEICEQSLQFIKGRRSSIIVPLGSLRFGVCRHRALLLKYLCDRMKPSIPCELVRGYLDFFPHAWNIIPVKKSGSVVRMVVDACSPLQIREEKDPEILCRYIPLNRINHPARYSLFPRLLNDDEIDNSVSKSIIKCKMGSVEVAAKIRKIEVSSNSYDEVRAFELAFLGEVRILNALRHPSIVKIYGHQISSKWAPSENRRTLHSAIFMEYVEGGSLKSFIDGASEAGKKRVPVKLALCIAKHVACALMELHSKHIIHRDIKSENILFSMGSGRPVVKLCDFDRAVPLRSHLHKCCIAHLGNPPPNTCVGTPRWMAPEVLRAFNHNNFYGLEIDIWSFGCLLYELLTLQIPYFDVPEWRIHELIEVGERPHLNDDLEALATSDCFADSEDESDLRFLVSLFGRCTEALPENRPSASDIYSSLKERVVD